MQVDIIQNGLPLRAIFHGGQAFRLVSATGDFQVRLRNDSNRRRLVILSVDGVNVIDGSTAGWEGGGYLLAPHQTLDVPGWLKSHAEVAKFTFASPEASYAVQTGRGTTNVGVIGAAVFDEAAPVRTMIRRRVDGTMHKSAGTGYGATRGGVWASTSLPDVETKTSSGLIGSAIGSSVGAAYGDTAAFETQAVAFQRSTSSPVETTIVRYGTREQLLGWGVPSLSIDQLPLPNPFPAATGFVPPPPGYRG